MGLRLFQPLTHRQPETYEYVISTVANDAFAFIILPKIHIRYYIYYEQHDKPKLQFSKKNIQSFKG